MTVTLYLRVLAKELEAYERSGWTFVCALWPIGGWAQCLVKKNVTG